MWDRALLPNRIANLRDAGGLTTNDGIVLRPYMLLRSSTLACCTPATARCLTQLAGVGDYIDLRTDREIDRDGRPDALIATGWSWYRRALQDEPTQTAMVRDDVLADHVSAAATVANRIAHTGGQCPVVVACSLGKDRTGIVFALLLRWLGVGLEQIFEDFLLSNDCLRQQRTLLPPRWQEASGSIRHVQVMKCKEALAAAENALGSPLAPAALSRFQQVLVQAQYPSDGNRGQAGSGGNGQIHTMPRAPTTCEI